MITLGIIISGLAMAGLIMFVTNEAGRDRRRFNTMVDGVLCGNPDMTREYAERLVISNMD